MRSPALGRGLAPDRTCDYSGLCGRQVGRGRQRSRIVDLGTTATAETHLPANPHMPDLRNDALDTADIP
jgi:hypothetical protein